ADLVLPTLCGGHDRAVHRGAGGPRRGARARGPCRPAGPPEAAARRGRAWRAAAPVPLCAGIAAPPGVGLRRGAGRRRGDQASRPRRGASGAGGVGCHGGRARTPRAPRSPGGALGHPEWSAPRDGRARRAPPAGGQPARLGCLSSRAACPDRPRRPRRFSCRRRGYGVQPRPRHARSCPRLAGRAHGHHPLWGGHRALPSARAGRARARGRAAPPWPGGGRTPRPGRRPAGPQEGPRRRHRRLRQPPTHNPQSTIHACPLRLRRSPGCVGGAGHAPGPGRARPLHGAGRARRDAGSLRRRRSLSPPVGPRPRRQCRRPAEHAPRGDGERAADRRLARRRRADRDRRRRRRDAGAGGGRDGAERGDWRCPHQPGPRRRTRAGGAGAGGARPHLAPGRPPSPCRLRVGHRASRRSARTR
ncbi:MAG: Glycosyltransferase, partial [uncultured Thermomicrobiales bacterium]